MNSMNIDNILYKTADNSFELSIRKAYGHTSMPSNHFHDNYEIYYLLSGERFYFIKDRTYRVEKGDLVFINKKDLHKTTDTGIPDHERILINFSKAFILSSDPVLYDTMLYAFHHNYNLVRFSAEKQQHVEGLLTTMLQEAAQAQHGYEVFLRTYLMQLLTYTTRHLEQNLAGAYQHPSPTHKRISEIVQYLNEHYMEDLSLPSVAERFFISTYHLARVFKETTGFTFVEYLNSVRIREAQRLLCESESKVMAIAEKVGFGSIAHFGRVFKEVTGTSPLHYRKISTL